MVIGVHAVAAFRPQPTGVEIYAREILRALAKLPDASGHRFLLYTNRMAHGPWPMAHVEERVLRAPALWTQARLSWEMLRRPSDVLFVPAQAPPRILPKRTAVTIHGLEFERVPEAYALAHRRYLRFVTRDAARRADAIIAVSEATKRDLVSQYGANPDRITVIHHGAPLPPAAGKPETRNQKPIPPYFLYVGRLELKKNVDGIVRAFSRFRERHPEMPYELVFAGAPGFGYEHIRETITRSSAREAVHIRGYAGENEKWRLLRGAEALLFPSRAEGFGMPILEAQAVETPVITGDTTAMPEVAGYGAIFVPPGDDGALADAMERIENDAGIRARLIAAGTANLRRFSWEEAARQTLRVLLEY